MAEHASPVRGTQSFVAVMQFVWKHPSLTGLEVAWRWTVGVPVLVWVWLHSDPLVRSDPTSWPTLAMHGVLGWQTPSWPGIFAAALLLAAWCVWAATGRWFLLRRFGARRASWSALAVFSGLRTFLFAAVVILWAGALSRIARGIDWNAPSFAVQPNLVPKFAMAVVTTLALFILWCLISWRFSVPLAAAADEGLGVPAALRRTQGQRAMISKIVEINFVMGIVKVALLVLAMTFSACPLPFQSVATPDFMTRWWIGVAVLYLLASDFFHVVRLASGLELWRNLKSPSA